MSEIFKYLRDLTSLNAVSGDEKAVADYIKSVLRNVSCEIKTDNLGNLMVFKKGLKKPKNKIMLSAHMDEVGFIVQGINSDGFISLSAVGGISSSVLTGRTIKFSTGVSGVIGGKPVHLLDGDEKDKQPKLSELYADIGAKNKDEAEKYVCLGDDAYFDSEYIEFGDGLIKAKAIDDRFGCAVMLSMLTSEIEFDMCFVFTVQEEVGTRGASVAAYSVNLEGGFCPDFAIVLEATTACDISDVSGEKEVCALGKGSVVPFMDKGTVYDKELYKLVFETAAENNLKCQTKTQVAGGNDSAAIHKSAGGIRTVAVCVPCRYLHTPSCVVSKKDCLEMRVLAEKLAYRLAEI